MLLIKVSENTKHRYYTPYVSSLKVKVFEIVMLPSNTTREHLTNFDTTLSLIFTPPVLRNISYRSSIEHLNQERAKD